MSVVEVRAHLTLMARLRDSVDTVYRELVKFGAVGVLAFVVDFGVFNLLRVGPPGMGGHLTEKPLTAKTISVVLATLVAWLGNRYWTFRHRRRSAARHELFLFAVMNAAALLIALACLAFSHYVLGLTSALADNVAGNVVGLLLGTAFRFWTYKRFVFTQELSDIDAAHAAKHAAEQAAEIAAAMEAARPAGPAVTPVTRSLRKPPSTPIALPVQAPPQPPVPSTVPSAPSAEHGEA